MKQVDIYLFCVCSNCFIFVCLSVKSLNNLEKCAYNTERKFDELFRAMLLGMT